MQLPKNGVFKGSKCNPGVQSAAGGVQKISHILVPIIRLKRTQDEDAAFAYYFVPGFKTKLKLFLPRCQNLKILPRLCGSFHDHKCVQKINSLLVKSK